MVRYIPRTLTSEHHFNELVQTKIWSERNVNEIEHGPVRVIEDH
jgi:hypothetical protein